MEKRNTAVDLTDLAIGLLILGIVVAIGTRVLILYRDARLEDLPILSVVNETNTTEVTDLSGSAWRLTNIWGIDVTACTNVTSLIPTSNYSVSVDSDSGFITVTNLSNEIDAQDWACTYRHYDTTEEQWSLPNAAAQGIGEYGNWFDIIVIVGIAGLILSLIFLAFGRNSGEETSVAY